MHLKSQLETKARVILRDNGYRLLTDGERWIAESGNIRIESGSLMGCLDRACPIIRDERLSALCAAV